MAVQWFRTKHKGLRYRKHPKRKHGVDFDRFYQFRHMTPEGRKEESLGWLSEGWTEDRCLFEILKIKQAKTTGEGPLTLADKRKIAERKRQAEMEAQQTAEDEARKLALINKPFVEHWQDYFRSDIGKKDVSWKTEQGLYEKWLKPVLGNLPLKKITDLILLW